MMRDTQKFANGQYDLLIIGGGINGSAIANMATMNGLRTLLIEKNDFASGTSSKSTKLVHGGLRYLEKFEFDLVKESLKERSIQLKIASHLVKPLGFIIPVYKTDRRPLWMIKTGVFLYDFLSGRHNIERHHNLTSEQILSMVPGLEKKDLLGGVMYYDAQMDDARLCLENVLQAADKGAHIANYMEAKEVVFENGKAVGVRAVDSVSNERLEIRAKKIVCCAGPWTNEFMVKERSRSPAMVRTTKGIHIVYKDRFSDQAIFLSINKDRRLFFIIPWNDNSLIGTTDTDFNDKADNVAVEEEDIAYLLDEVKRLFPQKEIKEEHIITTFAGLRPLVSNSGDPSSVSRKHVIKESYSGIYYVMGGKYTTYRKMAEDAIRLVMKDKPINTKDPFLVYGSGIIEKTAEDVAQETDLDVDIVENLMAVYGSRYEDILAMVKGDTSLKERLCTCSSAIKAQVIYSIKTEMALFPEDIIERRLSLVYRECSSKECRQKIEEIFQEVGA